MKRWALALTVSLVGIGCGDVDFAGDSFDTIGTDYERPANLASHWSWPSITDFEDAEDLYNKASHRLVMKAEVVDVYAEGLDRLIADELHYITTDEAFEWLVDEARWRYEQDYDHDYEVTTPYDPVIPGWVAFNPEANDAGLAFQESIYGWNQYGEVVLVTAYDPEQPLQPLIFTSGNRVFGVRPLLIGVGGDRLDDVSAFAYARALLAPSDPVIEWDLKYYDFEGMPELLSVEELERMGWAEAIAYIKTSFNENLRPHDWGWIDLAEFAHRAGELELARGIYTRNRPWRMCGTGWPFREDYGHRDVCADMGDTSCFLRLELSFQGRGWRDEDQIVDMQGLGFDVPRMIRGLMVDDQDLSANEQPYSPYELARMIQALELEDAFEPLLTARATNPSLNELDRLRATQMLYFARTSYIRITFDGELTDTQRLLQLDLSPLSRDWVEEADREQSY